MKRLGLPLVVFVLMLSIGAFAQTTSAPELLNFQGRLAKPDRTPVTDGTYSLRFSLWSAVSGGTEKWFQVMNPVLVKNGTFAVLLGNGNPITADILNGDNYLEVKVGTNSPLSPRQRIASVAYALKANTVPDNAITTPKIANSAVTNVKIQSVDWSKVTNSPTTLLSLPFDGSTSNNGSAFSIANNGFGVAIFGITTDGTGVYGLSDSSTGVYGSSNSYAGVVGNSNTSDGVIGNSRGATGAGVYGGSTQWYGVYGVSDSSYGVYGATNSEGGAGVYGLPCVPQ